MARTREKPKENTYLEAMEQQIAILRHLAQQLDTRGYCIKVVGLNPNARSNNYIYRYFAGAFDEFVEHWSMAPQRARRYPVVVKIWLGKDQHDNPAPLFDRDFTFVVQIPKRYHFKLLNIALEFISKESKRHDVVFTDALLTRCASSNNITYKGRNKMALRALLQVFETEHIKKILLTGDSRDG